MTAHGGVPDYQTYLLSRLKREQHPMYASDLYTATKHRHESRQTFYDLMRLLVREGQVTESTSRTGGILLQAVTQEEDTARTPAIPRTPCTCSATHQPCPACLAWQRTHTCPRF